MSRTFRSVGLVAVLLAASSMRLAGQSLSDPIDDAINCSTGKATEGLLPFVVDIISIEIRKENDDLVATVEFRGDPSFGDSVSGGILAFDPTGFAPDVQSDWHFDHAGNVNFGYAGDALSTLTAKSRVDSTGTWVADTTSGFSATRAGNVVVVRIPGHELGPGSVWMAYATSRLFELPPRCDVAGGDKNSLPILEVPQLVASEDKYEAAGNVRITVSAAEGLLANDIDAASVLDADATSEYGGQVAVGASGGFVFDPAPGFGGTDSFSYTATDGKGGLSTADVTIEVGPALWFVDAAASGPGSGRWSDPFLDVKSLELVTGTPWGPKPSDAILIFGDTVYASSLVLDSAQVVVGQGVDMLAVLAANGYYFPPYSDLLSDPPVQTAAPTLTSDTLSAIELGRDNRIFGLVIGDTPRGAAIRGDSIGTTVVSDVTIRGTGTILDVGNGVIDVALDSAASDSALIDAILLRSVDGVLAILNPTTIRSPGRDGLRVLGGNVEIDVPELHVFDADSGAAVTVVGSPAGRRNFDRVTVSSIAGRGFVVDDGGELFIGSGTIETGGTALDLRSVLLDATLDALSASGTHGVHLSSTSGTLTIEGQARIDSTTSSGLNVDGSSVRLRFSELKVGRADSAFGVRLAGSPGSVFDAGRLEIENPRGGGITVQAIDSVIVDSGFVFTRGGPLMDLRDVVADIRIDSLTTDSAASGIVLINVGGSLDIRGGTDAEGTGRIGRISGRAVNAINVMHVQMRNIELLDVSADALRLQNFGDVRLTGLDIRSVDSAAVRAMIGGRLEIENTVISNARTGILSSEVDDLILTGNRVTDTDTSAVVVTNATLLPLRAAKQFGLAAGDARARILGNEVLTGALDGIAVYASSAGSLRLELSGNKAISSANDYVLASSDPAKLLLEGFAGGDNDAVTAYVQTMNVGSPRVKVIGAVDSGPSGLANVVAIDKTVSDPEPLPERMIEYRIRVTNQGPSPALSVAVMDSLPDGLTYVPATVTLNGVLLTDGSDEDAADFAVTKPRTVTVRLGDLSVADTAVVTFDVLPAQSFAGSSVTNSAWVEAESPDSTLADNRAEAVINIKLNTAVESNEVPKEFALRQNYPNPFNPSTTIGFDIPRRSFVRVTVLNVLGQIVQELVARDFNPGRYEVRWDADSGHGATSGLYFYRLEAGSFTSTRRMIFLK